MSERPEPFSKYNKNFQLWFMCLSVPVWVPPVPEEGNNSGAMKVASTTQSVYFLDLPPINSRPPICRFNYTVNESILSIINYDKLFTKRSLDFVLIGSNILCYNILEIDTFTN